MEYGELNIRETYDSYSLFVNGTLYWLYRAILHTVQNMITSFKLLLRCLLRMLYRVEITGMENYTAAGRRVLIVANHTSLLDGALLYAWLPETPVFAINTQVARKKFFCFFLQLVDLFRMDTHSPLSIKSMVKFLSDDKKVVIFPEGRITTTGSLMKIYEGPGLIADRSGATVLPISIDGAQFSPFAYNKENRRTVWFPKITITLLSPQTFEIDKNLYGHKRRVAATQKMQAIMHRIAYNTFNHRQTIFNAFLEAARRHGYNTPIVEDIKRKPVSYRMLIMHAMLLGKMLGDGPDRRSPVGIMLPNTTAAVALFLATQYTARITAMINFTAGANMVANACETAAIQTVYTSTKFVENAKLQPLVDALKSQVRIVYLEDTLSTLTVFAKLSAFVKSRFPKHFSQRRQTGVSPDDPAVILFTSGSESQPKGVVLSHSNILSNYAQAICHINFTHKDIVFSCLPLFHSFGLTAGCLMPLLAGSKAFFYPKPLHYKIIPELIYELGASILFGSNTFFKGYARHAHPFDFHTLRYAVAGAEKLHDDTQRLWMDKFGIRIYQGYGVTETSPVLSVNSPMANKPGSVGRLVTGTTHYLEPIEGIPEGGRLFVKGPNIMLGYLLPDQQDKIQPPYSERGIGWHDTGDVAFIDEDGFLYIMGRAKRFAKIGGEMVSLVAVENLALQTWPDFTHAAVSVSDADKGEHVILVTDKPGANRQTLQAQIRQDNYNPLYLPKQVLLIDRLPVLGSGKIDYPTLTKLIEQATREGRNRIN